MVVLKVHSIHRFSIFGLLGQNDMGVCNHSYKNLLYTAFHILAVLNKKNSFSCVLRKKFIAVGNNHYRFCKLQVITHFALYACMSKPNFLIHKNIDMLIPVSDPYATDGDSSYYPSFEEGSWRDSNGSDTSISSLGVSPLSTPWLEEQVADFDISPPTISDIGNLKFYMNVS